MADSRNWGGRSLPVLDERLWFALVVVVSALVRLGLWLVYPLTVNNDSPTYLQLARNILNNGFSAYNATRTPGYPLFLAYTGDWVYPAQLGLGMATTILVYYIASRLSGRAWFGALAALLHTLNIGQLFFEATLLTETLTTFLVMAALGAAIAIIVENHSIPMLVFFAFLAGLSASLAGMVRPLFVYLPVLISIFCLAIRKISLPKRAALAVAVLVPAVLIFGWWLNFVNSNYKILSFDTIGGFRWLNHTGEYFEYVPDSDAIIRDTYIRYRSARIAETGSQSNAAWDAMDELLNNSRLGFYGLSRHLTDISMDLIRAHPDLYLKNVFSGWWMFWWAAVYWSSDMFKAPALVPVVRILVLGERGVMVLANLIFIGGSLASALWKKARSALGMGLFGWLVLVTVGAASVLQTLLDHGDNPRYLVPLQTVVLVMVAWWLCQIFIKWNAGKR